MTFQPQHSPGSVPSGALRRILDEHKLRPLELLQENIGKHIAVWLVVDENKQKWVIKHSFTKPGQKRHAGFENELAFYRDNNVPFAPRLAFSGDDFFCIQYIEGKPLLRFLRCNQISREMADFLCARETAMVRFFSADAGTVPANTKEFTAHMVNCLSKLFNSGPWDSRRNALENFLFRQAWRLLRCGLRWRIGSLLEQTQRLPPKVKTHNDFHQNNILLTKSNELFLIDFENYSEGYWAIDLLYGLTTLYATGRVNRDSLRIAIEPTAREYPVLNSLLEICLTTAAVNRRFSGGSFSSAIRNFSRLGAFALLGRNL